MWCHLIHSAFGTETQLEVVGLIASGGMAQRRRDLTTTSFPTVYNLTFSLSHFCPIFLSSPGWSPRQTPPYRVPPAKQLSTRPFILSTHFPRRLLSATHVCFAAYSLLARDLLYVLLVLCFLWRKALSLVGPCIPTSFPPQVYLTRVLPPNIYPGSDQQIRNDASHCRSHSSSIFAITRQ